MGHIVGGHISDSNLGCRCCLSRHWVAGLFRGVSSRPRCPRSGVVAGPDWLDQAREVLDHVIVFGEHHLWQVLLSYMTYHNEARTHLSLKKDAPVPRTIQGAGRIFAKPLLGGLHHQYVRI